MQFLSRWIFFCIFWNCLLATFLSNVTRQPVDYVHNVNFWTLFACWPIDSQHSHSEYRNGKNTQILAFSKWRDFCLIRQNHPRMIMIQLQLHTSTENGLGIMVKVQMIWFQALVKPLIFFCKLFLVGIRLIRWELWKTQIAWLFPGKMLWGSDSNKLQLTE